MCNLLDKHLATSDKQKHKISRLETIVANDNAYTDGAYPISESNYLLVRVISIEISVQHCRPINSDYPFDLPSHSLVLRSNHRVPLKRKIHDVMLTNDVATRK